MRETAILLWFTIAVAVVFDFTNGFHDTANAIATSISTRALSPRAAVGLSAVFNLVGAVVTVAFFQAKVSNTIASTLAIKPGLVVVMAALLGAIAWNLITWYRGLPSSSTHALIGGLCGAGIAAAGGLGGVKWSALVKQVASLVISPPLGFLAAGIFAVLLTVVVYRAGWRPAPVNRTLRGVQVVTSAYLSFSHGANDARPGGFGRSAEVPGPSLGGRSLRGRDRLWDLRRRVAHHQDDGLEHPEAGARDGYVSATHGRDRDSSRDACRTTCQHDACDHGGGNRRRRQPKAILCPLGSRRQHHRRVVRDDSRVRADCVGRFRHPPYRRVAWIANAKTISDLRIHG